MEQVCLFGIDLCSNIGKKYFGGMSFYTLGENLTREGERREEGRGRGGGGLEATAPPPPCPGGQVVPPHGNPTLVPSRQAHIGGSSRVIGGPPWWTGRLEWMGRVGRQPLTGSMRRQCGLG